MMEPTLVRIEGAVYSHRIEERVGGPPKSTHKVQYENHMTRDWQEHTTSGNGARARGVDDRRSGWYAPSFLFRKNGPRNVKLIGRERR
jgi:hypothetical protein